jgi:hypothetical protein
MNAIFSRLLPLLEPTRSDPILPNFHNYREMWGEPVGANAPASGAPSGEEAAAEA